MKQIDVPYAKLSLPYAVASGFYSGCLPIITRGTAGSVMSTIPAVVLWQLWGNWALFWGIAGFFFAGWWAVSKIEQTCGPRFHDASVFVIDEWVGQWMCLAVALPFFWESYGLGAVVVSLLTFAVFDGLKPWPIRAVDKYVGGGFGVMFDDVLAGVAAGGVMFGLTYLL